eukprot:3341086-Pyramimonas_sp.AAC.1
MCTPGAGYSFTADSFTSSPNRRLRALAEALVATVWRVRSSVETSLSVAHACLRMRTAFGRSWTSKRRVRSRRQT